VDSIVSQRVLGQRWYERFPRAVPVTTFLLAMALTLLSVWAIEQVEEQRREAQARAAASVVGAALDRRAHSYISYMRAGSMLLGLKHEPSRDDFVAVAGGMLEDAEYHGQQGIGWLTLLTPDQVPAFQKRMRAQGAATYTVHPGPDPSRALVAPLTYIADMNARNGPTLGFDVYSEPVRRATLDRTIARRQLTASGPVKLVMPVRDGEWQGFLLYMPVYAPGHPERPRGFISAPFNAGAFLTSIVALEKIEGLGVGIYDGAVSADHVIARLDAPGRHGAATVQQTLLLGGRRTIIAVNVPDGELSRTAWVALVLGTAIAALLAAVARIVSRKAQEDRASLLWLREQVSIRASLTRELNHRVKNTLANVLSLIALTKRRATGLDQFVEGLQGRIRALSATHDLLTDTEWGPTPLRKVVEAELAPYRRVEDLAVVLIGPEVDLAPNDALSLGLALHELATNASKYGALSVADGRVEVRWSMADDTTARLHWSEAGGPPVPSTRGRGFGTDLIEKIVAHELGHDVDLDFAVTGVRCTLYVPVRAPTVFHMRARAMKEGVL
jgi:two-component sensor histidine kinase